VTRAFPALAILALVLFVSTAADAQCAMCRQALESSEGALLFIEKLNVGILLLLAAPFGVVSAIGVAWVRSERRIE